MEHSVFGTFILILTALFTYNGFKDSYFFDKYKFHVDKILIGQEYIRTISSGFLHGGWLHFGFNMIALTSFSMYLELEIGIIYLATLYFACIIGGSLLALYIHRNHGNYSAIGASGGVSGLVLASIVLDPMGEISFILIPISFTNWIIGLLYIILTIYGIKTQAGNIGHEAHLGGALIGAIAIILMVPELIFTNWWIFLLMVVPILLFLIVLIRNPNMMMIKGNWGREAGSIKNVIRKTPSVDDILDKVSKSGVNSLTYRERKILEDYRKTL